MNVKLAAAIGLIVFAIIPASVSGQTAFPTRPIQVFVGMAPGGSVDVLVRALARRQRSTWARRWLL